MENSKTNLRFGVLSLITLLAAFSILLPHPPNLGPISAMVLFEAPCFDPMSL